MVALAVLLARRALALRPVASGLLALVCIEVARLFTRETVLDRVLFVAWAGVVVAPAVVLLPDRTPPASNEDRARARPATSDAQTGVLIQTPPGIASWAPRASVVVVLAFLVLGGLVAWVSPVFRAPSLRPWWPAVLGATRVLATGVTAYAVAERVRRAGGRWRPLTRVELAALVLPLGQLADVLTLWAFGGIGRWWIARVLTLVTCAVLGAILVSCSLSTASTTPPSSRSG